MSVNNTIVLKWEDSILIFLLDMVVCKKRFTVVLL